MGSLVFTWRLPAGTTAVTLSGTGNVLERCEIAYPGDGGVFVSGGVRASLTPGGNVVRNCDIHDFSRWCWTYRPALQLAGVGQVVAHNHLHDAPHSAIIFRGNDHVIEYNQIDHVLRFSSDAGAIYTGRDWGYRGNEVRYNFIHDLSTTFEGYGTQGIYLDDCVSGIHVHGNVLYRIATAAVQNGGGRDDVIENNLMVKCKFALIADNRGITRIDNTPGSSWNLLERLGRDGIAYQQPPWSERYPSLAAIPTDWQAISAPGALWRYPQGCVFSRNVGWGNQTFKQAYDYNDTGVFDKYAESVDNLEHVDPHFVDESQLDLRLKADSPALAIPGFEPVPFERIGIEP